MAWIDDEHREALAEQGTPVSLAEYYYLANVANMQKSKTHGFWCAAPNSFFCSPRKMNMSDKGLRKMQDRLIESGLLEKGAGSKKRATPLFTDWKIHEEQSTGRNLVPEKAELSTGASRNLVPEKAELSTDKIKESKSKVNKTKESLPFSSDSFREAWELWEQHRREIKHPLKATTKKLQLKKLSEMGEQRAIDAIYHSAEQGWQGIYEKKPETNEVDWKLVNQTAL